ncbi:MAG: type II toxin-antitoxin system RelE/ParE family toxin [Alphaproteobacteria bacterium]
MIVRYSRAAKLQMIEIWRYSARRWGETRARRYLTDIDQAICAVRDGRRQPRAVDAFPALSKVSAASHHAYLALDHEADVLHVVAVLHQRVDPKRRLKKLKQE